MQSNAKKLAHPSHMVGGRPARCGFTLVEVLVVMFIISILAYLALPKIEVVRFRMDGAARGAVATLVAAQRLAVKRQHDVAVMFDVAESRLLIHQDRDNDGQIDDGEPIRVVAFDEGVVFGRGSAPALPGWSGALTFSGTHNGLPAVRFIRNGSASEEGVIYLTSTRGAGDAAHAKDSRAVRLDRPTGRVTWLKYKPPSWVEGI